MTSNKVFSVLTALNRTDRRRLVKFMASPYFNQSKPLTQLCDFFLEKLEGGAVEFERADAFNAMFSNAVYDDTNFRKYCSDLLGLIEDFLAVEQFTQKKSNKKLATIEAVREKKFEALYSSSLRDARKELSQNGAQSSTFYYQNYLIEKGHYELMELEKKGVERFNVEDILLNLDNFYFIEKIKYYCSVLSQKNLLNQDYNIEFIYPVINYLKSKESNSSPVLSIYLSSYLTLSEPENIEHYFKLKELLIDYSSSLEKKEAVNLFDSAMNYCIRKMNQGKSEFYQEYFELAEKGLKESILLENGEITHWRFNNIVANALRLGKVEWADKFIGNNKEYLPETQRENVVSFSLSRLHWYQKDYNKVLEVIRNVEYEDFNYSLISKSTLLKAYFELNEFDALISFIETFSVYINRHKEIPVQRKKTYSTLISYTRKLVRLNVSDKKAVSKLNEEISKSEDFPSKSWLLEKLEELTKRKS